MRTRRVVLFLLSIAACVALVPAAKRWAAPSEEAGSPVTEAPVAKPAQASTAEAEPRTEAENDVAKPAPKSPSEARPKILVEPPAEPSHVPEGLSAVVVPNTVTEVETRVEYAPGSEALLPLLRVTETPSMRMKQPRKELSEADKRVLDVRPLDLRPYGEIDELENATEATPTALTVSWESFTIFNTGSIPPDPYGAAGPSHVLNVVNQHYAIYDKVGGLQSTDSLFNFFSPLANPPPGSQGPFDPKVLYDTFHNRFVVVALSFGGTPQSAILVAVSDDSNPNGTWFKTEINAVTNISGQNHFADYPGLGVDEEAIYVTANLFRITPPSTFANSRLWVVRKGVGTGGLYDGGAATVTVHAPPGTFNFSMQPAHLMSTHPNATVGTYVSSYNGLNDGAQQYLQVYTLTNPLAGLVFNQQFVPLGVIDNLAVSVPLAPQAEAVPTNIDSGDRRVWSTVWRGSKLYATTTLVPPAGGDAGQATAHWFHLNTTTFNMSTVTDQGNISGNDIAPTTHTFYPSVAVNSAGALGFGFAASAPTIYPGAYYTFRAAADPPGTVQPSQVLRAGIDRYIATDGSRNRWGDYSGTAVDPVNDCFWFYNEYSRTRQPPPAPVNNNGVWGTAWGAFCFAPVCGNSVVEPGETCDPPGVPAGQPNECRLNCTFCGDGTLQAPSGEQCDDGNNAFGDGCDANCKVEICGNGIVQLGEECDPPGAPAGPNVCRFNCTFCGDGDVDAGGGELLDNGDFEFGNLAGWTVSAAGLGSVFADTPGTTLPISGLPSAPNGGGGTTYSVSDETGPGTHALSQTFTVPADASSAVLSFDMFVNNWNSAAAGAPGPHGTFIDAAGLDHTTANPNQHGRVDLVNTGFGPFDTSAGAVVNNYYIGADPLSPPENPYTNYNIVITGDVVPGQTYDIRFAETANMYFMNQGVDNVSIALTTPAETCDDGNNLAGDGCTSTCQLCAGPMFFAQTLLALDENTFVWTSPADIDFVRGSLASLPTYGIIASGSAAFTTTLPVPQVPAPGAGFYVIVRTDCPGGTWTSGGSGECNPPLVCPPGGRDGNLPP